MPAVLVCYALAMLLWSAHFLRAGLVLPAALCLCVLLLFLVRQLWVLWVLQGLAYLAAASWAQTAMHLVAQRQAQGRSWTAGVAILGAVALFSAVAGLLLNLPVMRRVYPTAPQQVRQP